MGVIKNLALNVEKLMLWGDKLELKITSALFGFGDVENEISTTEFRNNNIEKYNIDDGGNKIK